MAGLHAILYRVDRAAERLPVERPSTLRGPDGKPVDATIDDLSLTGCKLAVPASAAIEQEVMIGLAGVGIRTARVVWSEADQIGCEFDTPLTNAELQTVQFARTVEEGRFPSLPTQIVDAPEDSAGTPRLAPVARLAIIGGLATASWALVGGIATAGYLLIAN